MGSKTVLVSSMATTFTLVGCGGGDYSSPTLLTFDKILTLHDPRSRFTESEKASPATLGSSSFQSLTGDANDYYEPTT
jgi:hypothetical protein